MLVDEAQETWVQVQATSHFNSVVRRSHTAKVAVVCRAMRQEKPCQKTWQPKQGKDRKIGELCGCHKRFGDEARKCQAACPRWAVKLTEVFVVENQTDTDPEN